MTEPPLQLGDQPSHPPDLVTNGGGGRTAALLVGATLALLIIVGITSSGDDAAAPTTTGTPDTSIAPTTSMAPTTSTTSPPTSLVSQLDIGIVPSVDAVVLAIDVDRNLVSIDVETGVVERHELVFDPGFVQDIHPYGDDFALVGLDSVQIVSTDFASVETLSGSPIAWDSTSVWADIDGRPDMADLFGVYRPDEVPRTIVRPNFDIGDPTVDAGALVIDGPTGVWRLPPDGSVEIIDELTHRRRGPVRLVTTCEGLVCAPVLRHDDGRTIELPEGADVAEIAMSWDGRLVAGGPAREGWVLSTVTGESNNLVRPFGEMSWAYGSDLLIITENDQLMMLDTSGLPAAPIGLAWRITLPTDTRPFPFLVVTREPDASAS